MKLGMRMLGILMCLALMPAAMRAQDQVKTLNDAEATAAHLRVDFLLTEYNGQEKTSSMPYTMYVEARTHELVPGRLRMGVRVPIPRSTVATEISYEQVGTDIDCTPSIVEGGTYDLQVVVNRSSVYTADNGQGKDDQILRAASGYPVTRNFNAEFNVKLRDGETVEGTSATDPFNGHVLKVTVTLHVLK